MWGDLAIRYCTIRAALVVLALILTISLAGCVSSKEGRTPESPGPTTNGIANQLETAASSDPNSRTPSIYDTGESQAQRALIDLSDALADIVEAVQPAVVFISAQIETQSFFFNRRTLQASSGSGVIVSSEGYILTNNHVVADAVEIEVTVPGFPEPFEAEIVGTDSLSDLAVIEIEGEDLPFVPFGNASTLRPGNLVIAIGYPLALEEGATITLGVVSNTERSFTLDDATFYDVIQTDAAINPGNSGGPLVDLNGQIVGINSVVAGTAQNIGFAVSVNTAQPVYEALIGPDHRVVRPWLGVVLVTLTPDIAADIDIDRQSGVVVRVVEEDSPADAAGIQVHDVITRFDGVQVTTATQLIKELWRHHVGDETVEEPVLRGVD